MRLRPRLRAPLPALLCALALIAPAWAKERASNADEGRPSLVVRGRVSDAEGFPIPKARVSAGEPRRAFAVTDEAGQFSLRLPLATVQELAREPYRLTLRAEAKGWRLGVPGGDAVLGLELRMVPGLDGVARCVARSNDVRVAAVAAHAVEARGESPVVVVNFIGERGSLSSAPAMPELSQTAQVALPGAAAPPVAAANPDTANVRITVTQRPPPAPRKPPAPAPALESPAVGTPTASVQETASPPAHQTSTPAAETAPAMPPAPTGQAVAPAPRPAATDRRAKSVKRPAAASDAAAKPGSPWWSALFGHRGEAAAATTGGSEAERLLAESKRRGTSETPEARRREHDEARDRWQVLRNEVNRVAGASDTTTPPPLAKLESHAGAPAVPEPRPVEAAPRGVRATLSPVRAPAPSPLPELTAPEADRQDEAAAAPNRVRIHPPPQGSGRVRAAPLVIRGASARPGAEPASDDSCRCRIEGTVEVDSQDPLASRVQVAVSLAWYPAAADTVELFMGSPRAFRLAPAPCGPQRLKVVVLRGERLVVTSRDAVAGFRCDDRGLRQVRVVLAPR